MEEDLKETKTVWMSVPAFGDWDMKQGVPDYSLDFSKIREARKINKTRISIGNEDELLPRHSPRHDCVEISGQPDDNEEEEEEQQEQQQQQQPQRRQRRHRTWKKLTSCFACGVQR